MTAPKPSKTTSAPPAKTSKSKAHAATPEVDFPAPLKPRPRLTMVLGIVFVLWLAVLVVLRVTTVHRVPGRGTETDQPLTR